MRTLLAGCVYGTTCSSAVVVRLHTAATHIYSCDHKLKLLHVSVIFLLFCFSSQVLSQTISRLSWTSFLSSLKGRGEWGVEGCKSAWGSLRFSLMRLRACLWSYASFLWLFPPFRALLRGRICLCSGLARPSSTANSGQGSRTRSLELLLQAAGDCRPNLGPALLKTLRRKWGSLNRQRKCSKNTGPGSF